MRAVFVLLVCSLFASALGADIVANLKGVWQGKIGDCDLTTRFADRNYVGVVSGCDCVGTYLGVYGVAGGSSTASTLVVLYSSTPECYEGPSSRPIQVAISGSTMSFKDVNGDFDTVLTKLSPTPLEGVWSGSTASKNGPNPFVSDVDGPLFLSYTNVNAQVPPRYQAYFGVLNLQANSAFSITYVLFPNNTVGEIGTAPSFSGGTWTKSAGGWTLDLQSSELNFTSTATALLGATPLDGVYSGFVTSDSKRCMIFSQLDRQTFRSYNLPSEDCRSGAFLGAFTIVNNTHISISYGYATEPSYIGRTIVAEYVQVGSALNLSSDAWGGTVVLTRVTAPSPAALVNVVLRANFSTFTDADLMAVINAIAARTGFPAANIQLLEKKAGSVILSFAVLSEPGTPTVSEFTSSLQGAASLGGFDVSSIVDVTPPTSSSLRAASVSYLLLLISTLLLLWVSQQ